MMSVISGHAFYNDTYVMSAVKKSNHLTPFYNVIDCSKIPVLRSYRFRFCIVFHTVKKVDKVNINKTKISFYQEHIWDNMGRTSFKIIEVCTVCICLHMLLKLVDLQVETTDLNNTGSRI